MLSCFRYETRRKRLFAAIAIGLGVTTTEAQDLTPRAYVITPVGSNAITVAYSFFDGSVFTDPTVPVTDFKVRYHAQMLSYSRSLNLFGRSAMATVTVPYAVGNFRALVTGVETQAYRSGLADARFRLSVNLRGGPAMRFDEYPKWHERTIVGASLTVVTPTGQYDPARLINPGQHRWAIKPELGFSRRSGRWTLDLYGGVWVFGANRSYFPGNSTREQAPVLGGEAHVGYQIKPRFWASADGNFWTGGQTTIDGAKKADLQRNSRVGGTVSIPLDRHQALKFSYSRGAYIAVGGDYQNLSAAWQYSWIGKPR